MAGLPSAASGDARRVGGAHACLRPGGPAGGKGCGWRAGPGHGQGGGGGRARRARARCDRAWHRLAGAARGRCRAAGCGLRRAREDVRRADRQAFEQRAGRSSSPAPAPALRGARRRAACGACTATCTSTTSCCGRGSRCCSTPSSSTRRSPPSILLYDLAFLLMDLERRGRRPSANLVLNRYLWRAQQRSRPRGAGGHAAAPGAARRRAGAGGGRQAAAARRRSRTRASAPRRRPVSPRRCGFLDPAGPRIVAVGGLSGTGKSTLAAALAPDVGPVAGGGASAQRPRAQGHARRGGDASAAGPRPTRPRPTPASTRNCCARRGWRRRPGTVWSSMRYLRGRTSARPPRRWRRSWACRSRGCG